MDILTKTRKAVLAAVVEATEATGVCPTLGMVCRRLSKLPRSTVRSAVESLERSGYVSWSVEHGAPIRPLADAEGRRFVIETRREARTPLSPIDGEPVRAGVLDSIADDIEADSVVGCAYLDTEARIQVDRGGYVYVLGLVEVRRG